MVINTDFNYEDNIKRDTDSMRKRHLSYKDKHRATRRYAVAHKNYLIRLSKAMDTYYFSPSVKITVDGKKGKSTYYKRCWKSKDSTYAFLKKNSNRVNRRKANRNCLNLRNVRIDFNSNDEFDLYDEKYGVDLYNPKNNQYRKHCEFWWLLY